METRPGVMRPDVPTLEQHRDAREAAVARELACQPVQGGHNEDAKCRDDGCWMFWETKDESVVIGGFRTADRRECGRHAWLHVDASEMNLTAESALDNRLDEIIFAHADTAGGDDDI